MQTMHVAEIAPTVSDWRRAARELLQQNVRPCDVMWQERGAEQGDLLAPVASMRSAPSVPLAQAVPLAQTVPSVPRAFLDLADSVACHSDNGRWDALYRVLYRLTNGESSLLDVATDADMYRLRVMDKAVRRDVHKMHAFVRFRVVESTDTDSANSSAKSYIAWFEPAHHVVERAVPLFTRRFASMRWSILTPRCCAHWNGSELQFTPGVSRSMAPGEDALEDLWRTYYAHIFNPARLSTSTMRSEMPVKYWHNLPEARLISGLARDAGPRVMRMLQQIEQEPAMLPVELRAQRDEANSVGDSRSESHAQRDESRAVAIESCWDAVHDPGVGAARQRATEVGVLGSSNDATLKLLGVPVRIGTASWTDPTILQRGVFYPDDVNTAEARLRYYASRFPLVEVDATYYVLPTRAMAAAWAARTPEHFVFDVKAFALMTGHSTEVKRLPDWLRRKLPRSMAGSVRIGTRELSTYLQDEIWTRFMSALAPLVDTNKLGPVLLQYPRWFTPTRESAEQLRVARERLGDACAAVEFRNPEWVTGRIASRTMRLLEELQFTYVIVDAPPGTSSSMPPVAPLTTPGLTVVRLHGRRSDTWEAHNPVVSERYRYLYDRREMGEWARRIDNLGSRLAESAAFPVMAKAKQGVHVVFNNCHANYGTTNADEITALLIEFDKERRPTSA